jgi:thiol-disulfide isomerase/thioredoxin
VGRQRRLLLIIGGVFFAVVAAWVFIFREAIFTGTPGYEAEVGKVVPDVTLADSNFGQISLQKLLQENKNKKILHFWATWCLPCVHELPLLLAERSRLMKEGIDVILINYDQGLPEKTIPEVRAWMITKKMNFDTYFDFNGELLDKLSVNSLPFAIGLGRDKHIQWMRDGELDWTSSEADVN